MDSISEEIVNPSDFAQLMKIYHILPQHQALNLSFIKTQGRDVFFALPWRSDLVGNAQTGALHGGALANLMDVAGAAAVAAFLQHPLHETFATVDFRMDYLYPSTPEKTVLAHAHCYQQRGQIAFVRMECFHEEEKEPIAIGTASYMRTPLPQGKIFAEHLSCL